MKIGSLVVCIDDVFPAWAKAIYNDLPVKDKNYKIRAIDYGVDVKGITPNTNQPLSFTGNKTAMVLLEEIKNPIHPVSKKEMGYQLVRFREIEPPKKEKEKIKESLPKKTFIKTPREKELIAA
jgi:hypothetical protein